MTKPCFFNQSTQPHSATIQVTYKFPSHPTKNHYFVCDEHRAEFSDKHVIAERRIKQSLKDAARPAGVEQFGHLGV